MQGWTPPNAALAGPYGSNRSSLPGMTSYPSADTAYSHMQHVSDAGTAHAHRHSLQVNPSHEPWRAGSTPYPNALPQYTGAQQQQYNANAAQQHAYPAAQSSQQYAAPTSQPSTYGLFGAAPSYPGHHQRGSSASGQSNSSSEANSALIYVREPKLQGQGAVAEEVVGPDADGAGMHAMASASMSST